MAGKAQYWLVTTQQADCAGYCTFVISTHPADYMAKQIDDALIFALPITKQQFRAIDKAWRGD
jgi:hypothetical protein